MAKGNQQQTNGRSVLRVAFEAFERGDKVQARQLAQAVLDGKIGKEDSSVAEALAPKLSSEVAQVAPTVEAVAKEIVSRTIVPPRPYIFVAIAAATYVILVVLAAVRY